MGPAFLYLNFGQFSSRTDGCFDGGFDFKTLPSGLLICRQCGSFASVRPFLSKNCDSIEKFGAQAKEFKQ
jgi:hypothetical protein